jgi:hypothetical protein
LLLEWLETNAVTGDRPIVMPSLIGRKLVTFGAGRI